MEFGSLFTGIGGFDSGFELAGMECAWQVEKDKYANQVLKQHWPNVKRYKDVNSVGERNLKPIGLICGGFPCQDLSVAGQRAGLAGERSGLWFEFARIIEELHPRWVVIENVPGLLSSNKGRDMGILTGKLAELGYWWAYRVLDSQYFGVAQRRRRVFIVGHLTEPTYPTKVLFEPESIERHTAPSREQGQGIAAPVNASSPSRRNGGSNPTEGTMIPEIVGSLDAGGSGSPKAHGGAWPGTTVQSVSAGHAIPEIVNQAMSSKWAKGSSGPAGDEHHNLIAFRLAGHGEFEEGVGTLRSTGGDVGGGSEIIAVEAIDVRNLKSNGEISGVLQSKEQGYSLNYQNPIAFHNRQTPISGEVVPPLGEQDNGMGIAWQNKQSDGDIRVQTDDKSPTLTKTMGTGGNNVPLVGVRRLTPLECERLQSFPDGWTAEGSEGPISDTQRYKMLGNAVTVNVIEWIGNRIMEVENS
jgi:DNA (cytosine-5)-methyltransferase 1